MKYLYTLLLIALFYQLQAQPIPTFRNVHDYDVGDEFHWYKKVGSYGSVYTKWIEKYEITGKSYASGNDTVYYVRSGTSTTVFDINGPNSTSTINDTISFDYLDTLVSAFYDIDTIISDPSKFNGRNQFIGMNYYFKDSSDYDTSWYNFVPGLGFENRISFLFPPNGTIYEQTLLYYKKGSEEWGNKFVGAGENEKEGSEIKIYPNPASNQIFIESQNLSNADIVELIDVRGQVQALQFQNRQGRLQLDVSDLAPGLYFIRLIIGNKVIASHTLVKQ